MNFDEILIEEVRNRPLLYDLGHADYKNLRKKDYAWKGIEALTGLNEMECKKRWKGLRDSYKRCKRMEQVGSGSGADSTRKRWKFMEEMSFLDNVRNSRRTIGNLHEVEYEETEVLHIEEDSAEASGSSRNIASESRQRKKNDSANFEKFLHIAGTSISL